MRAQILKSRVCQTQLRVKYLQILAQAQARHLQFIIMYIQKLQLDILTSCCCCCCCRAIQPTAYASLASVHTQTIAYCNIWYFRFRLPHYALQATLYIFLYKYMCVLKTCTYCSISQINTTLRLFACQAEREWEWERCECYPVHNSRSLVYYWKFVACSAR